MSWFEERAGLDGTVAVVTGGAGGLGRAIVTDLAVNGVRIAVLDKDTEAAAELRQALDEESRDALVEVGDARDPEVLAALFDAVDARWGRVDTLVNVVGGTFRAPFAETAAKGWDALIRTNLGTVLNACSLAVPRMRAGGGGSIVNMTTIEAHRAAPGFAVYAAAKAAVEQFARTLAVEVAPDGIRVNNVAPDYVPTPALARLPHADNALHDPAGVRVAIPMGRVGTPTDISHCVVFLASALSTYLTGTTLHPDGGTHASSGWFNWPEQGWANHAPLGLLNNEARKQSGT
ncbi:NAD(P)-dependent dehydrogenase (short-subunit alcohol dehydrogenase family) [Nocardia transvalensis]|uniref:NAD(P)-dependent dehydrogenase (Short-subunit alcohol dehydrogenase family) n=1 Tax=Nocardia transvalensis TaxID=37333 RepID=A0A7W9PGG9_9NOCA|nr:SDR family NAD(P)-dependent oxidoreductase [Nocardia transvalensis]MBB5915576.1 NAD(P)-dependent dehydrogenase (short-subunit alcohol dehydrogenase family) [Nocardia transvalensis]